MDYRCNNYYYHHHNHASAFGRWDYGDESELPYTQKCFEGAGRQDSLVGYDSYADRDLYVNGDFYQHDIVTTPAVIVVPRPMRKGGKYGYPNVHEEKKQKENKEWGYSYDLKEQPSLIVSPPIKPHKSKAVDEDLYQIPPEFLHVKPKRKRGGFGLFSSCLLPACV